MKKDRPKEALPALTTCNVFDFCSANFAKYDLSRPFLAANGDMIATDAAILIAVSKNHHNWAEPNGSRPLPPESVYGDFYAFPEGIKWEPLPWAVRTCRNCWGLGKVLKQDTCAACGGSIVIDEPCECEIDGPGYRRIARKYYNLLRGVRDEVEWGVADADKDALVYIKWPFVGGSLMPINSASPRFLG